MPNSIRPLFSSASFDRTRSFFKRLGFETWDEGRNLVVADDGAEIAYIEIPPDEGEPLPEPEHRDKTCVILVDDVMAWHERISTSRQRFRSLVPPTYRGVPRVNAWETLATAITDPDGNLIWFVERG
jgi:catechol 2,3-dioxygenase-like lactoylglutathione lyase family enzyme